MRTFEFCRIPTRYGVRQKKIWYSQCPVHPPTSHMGHGRDGDEEARTPPDTRVRDTPGRFLKRKGLRGEPAPIRSVCHACERKSSHTLTGFDSLNSASPATLLPNCWAKFAVATASGVARMMRCSFSSTVRALRSKPSRFATSFLWTRWCNSSNVSEGATGVVIFQDFTHSDKRTLVIPPFSSSDRSMLPSRALPARPWRFPRSSVMSKAKSGRGREVHC
jgi:hypothetical protein